MLYYLPKRNVVVTVTVPADQKPITLAVTPGNPIADLSAPYTAVLDTPWYGAGTATLGVNQYGLLGKADSTASPTATDVATALGSLAGTVAGYALPSAVPKTTGCPEGIHIIELPIDSVNSEVSVHIDEGCSIKVKVSRSGHHTDAKCENSAAIYFRYDTYFPTWVTLTIGSTDPVTLTRHATLPFPQFGRTGCLEPRTALFADQSLNIELENGFLKTVGDAQNNELVALIELPAGILKAYFAAIGAVFSQLNTAVTAEKDALAAETALRNEELREATTELQRKLCIDALNALSPIDNGAVDFAKVAEQCNFSK